MPVLLRRSSDLRDIPSDFRFVSIAGKTVPEGRGTRISNSDRLLERAYEHIEDEWRTLARALQKDSSSKLSHAAACVSYISDFGIMLAWSKIIDQYANDPDTTTVVFCDDPWMFRHLMHRPGVTPGKIPPLLLRRIKLAFRGYAARCLAMFRLARSRILLKNIRSSHDIGDVALLVYGHPDSEKPGNDAYFGNLITVLPRLKRMLHVDCGAKQAFKIATDGRTSSLHVWGSLRTLLSLPFVIWKPNLSGTHNNYSWLIRRASDLEGSTATSALIRWQIDCQQTWLKKKRPAVVLWPWENHAWERNFVRKAKELHVKTIGYQHTIVGRHVFNTHPDSNIDYLESFPDIIVCNSPAHLNQLAKRGVPKQKMILGGALRYSTPPAIITVKTAPVFVALSSDTEISRQILDAVKSVKRSGRVFFIKEHPMYPFAFKETSDVRRTTKPLTAYKELSAVIYATGTVGLESILAGLPTLRFMPQNKIAFDILPDGLAAATVTADELDNALDHLPEPAKVSRSEYLAPVDISLWKNLITDSSFVKTPGGLGS